MIERNEFFGTLAYDQEANKIKAYFQDPIHDFESGYYLKSPTNIFMEITTACNLECKHCFNDGNQTSHLSISEWKNIIDQAVDMKTFYVKITGGEPFLYPYLFDLIDYLETVGLNYIIYTNGFFVSKYINRLVNLKHLITIRVSVEGTKNINDTIRGDGAFEIAIKSIEELVSGGVNCSINYTINRNNYLLLPLLEKYLLNECNLSVPIHLGFIKHAGNSLENSTICFYDPVEYSHAITFVEDTIKNSTLIEPLYMLPEYYYLIYGNHFGCPAAQTSMVVKSNGDVIPCGLLPVTEFTLCGNAKMSSLQSIWTSNQMSLFRNLNPPARCSSCNHYLINCTGGCRANAFNLHDDIQGIDINCEIYKSSLGRQNRK